MCRQAGKQADRSAGKQDGWQVGVRAGLQASVCMSARVCIHENPHAVWLASIHADITTLLCPLIPSFPFFFWATWASGNDALKSEITALIRIRLLTDFLCSQKHSKGYPKAFRLLPKSGSSKVCFELLETFRVTPKALPPGCLSEVGQPVQTLRCSWAIPCTLCRIILSCCTAWYVRCRAMPQPICGCLSPVPAHG